jgi:phage regulator Rha-like protein
MITVRMLTYYSPIPNQLICHYNSEYKLIMVTSFNATEHNVKQDTITLDTSKQYKERFHAKAERPSKQIPHAERIISNPHYIILHQHKFH